MAKPGEKTDGLRSPVQSALWELPGPDGGMALVFTWRIPYSALEFRRVPSTDHYEADLDFSARLLDTRGQTELSRRDRNRLKPWAEVDTSLVIRALSYDSSRSGAFHWVGFTMRSVPGNDADGTPTVLPELRIQQPGREERTLSYPIHRGGSFSAEFIPLALGEDEEVDGTEGFTMLNRGRNILYGRDFDMLVVWDPRKMGDEPLQLRFFDGGATESKEPGSDAGAQASAMLEQRVGGTSHADSTRDILGFRVEESAGRVRLIPIAADTGGASTYRMQVVRVRGSELPNRKLLVSLSGDGTGAPDGTKTGQAARRVFESFWPDMPRSLLSLERSLKLLAHLAGEEQVERWLKGNREERIDAFHEFWDPKDPSPGTDLNELMVEYYRRADDATRRFSSPSRDGALGDQGKALMLYGEPDRVEREFPAGKPAIEQWVYPEFVLLFEATSGFGDFKLVERRTP